MAVLVLIFLILNRAEREFLWICCLLPPRPWPQDRPGVSDCPTFATSTNELSDTFGAGMTVLKLVGLRAIIGTRLGTPGKHGARERVQFV